MDYQTLINQEIMTKEGTIGQIVSFDNERITVRFNDGDKIYNPKVAFANHFLVLKDENLNHQLNEEFVNKEKEIAIRQEKVHQDAITRHKRVNALYQQLRKKDRIMKKLFGQDFIYPPFAKFHEQYRLIIDKEVDWFSSLSRHLRDKYL